MTKSASELRQKAAELRRLAETEIHPRLKAGLLELAEDFCQEAAKLEANIENGGFPPDGSAFS